MYKQELKQVRVGELQLHGNRDCNKNSKYVCFHCQTLMEPPAQLNLYKEK